MTRVLAIADDLTGALEAGALFAQAGFQTVVTTDGYQGFDEQVVVVDTETRHATQEDARATVAACASGWRGVVYKKTDSTLRGNIAAELRALYDLFGFPIVYVPAYPEMGRTVVEGKLRIHGVPIAETSFARDALNPIAQSEVGAFLDPACECVVFDGETSEDVRRAARSILESDTFSIIAGPAAIGGALARELGTPRHIHWPPIGRCLVVNGSRHDVSRCQIDAAKLDAEWQLFQPVVPANADALGVAQSTGEQVRNALTQHHYDALFVFGGDTAYGILKSLGSPSLHPIGEIIPGVPLSRIGGREELLITKAGGFGTPDLIHHLRRLLHAIQA